MAKIKQDGFISDFDNKNHLKSFFLPDTATSCYLSSRLDLVISQSLPRAFY
jgi:hypothetical protein